MSIIAGINDNSEGEIRSLIGYTNPELIRAFRESENDWDPNSNQNLISKINILLPPDIPATVLQPNLWGTVAHKRIKGFSSPRLVFPGPSMEFLWIEKEK